MKKLLLSLSALLMTVSAINAQIYFHEYFDYVSGGLPWTDIDGDGDGYKWQTIDLQNNDGHGRVARSQSYNASHGVLTPNNYFISPAIPLGTTNLQLQFDVKGELSNFSQEHYAVYVTTANDTATINATTPVFEETLPAQMNTYVTRTVDLSAYSGQTIYVTFRHFNITNMYSLLLDNVFVGKATDLALENIDMPSSAISGNINVKGTVKNLGTDTITSVNITYDDGSGAVSYTIPNLNILVGQTYDFTLPTPYTLAAGTNVNLHICATTSGDAEPSNNCLNKSIIVVSSQVDKHVVVEENTGTWCGFCPRGTIVMDNLHNDKPSAIGISIHDNDPMEVNLYNHAATTNFPGFLGFPNTEVDRLFSESTAYLFPKVDERKTVSPPASVSFDEVTVQGNTITVKPKVTMVANMTGLYGIVVVITEDSVKGTGNAWLQNNYYSSAANNKNLIDGNGVNWKNLPEQVDQSTVFGGYNHVARALANDKYNGDYASLPGTLVDGQSYSYSYTIPYDPSWNMSNLHAIAMFVDKTTGEIYNAGETPIIGQAGVANESLNALSLKVYPNPASQQANVTFTVAAKSDAQVTVYTMTGKVISTKALGTVVGTQTVTINTSQLEAGFYLVSVKTDNSVQTKRIAVVK